MKQTFIILLIAFTTIQCNAQKIHWLITSQSQQCREYFKRNFADIVNTALKETGVKSDFQDNAEKIQCNAEDIIIYCNLGRDSFEDIHNKLAVKNPKLIISVSAVCNDGVNNSLSGNTGSMYIAPEQMECIRDVFLNTCGVLIGSNCQLSSICESFLEMLEEQEISLETLFNSGEGNFKAQLQRCNFNPITDNNTHVDNNLPQKETVDMEQFFDQIVGSKRDVPNQNEIFAPDCVVFVIGQDGKTLIDRMSISTYLLRITMSTIMLRTVPIAKVMENGKIKQIYVREYYKK